MVGSLHHWDVYPYVLLNLLFSVQAAYTGPVLLLAGNRQGQKDRLTLEHAAAEADRTDTRTREILTEIKNNTDLTVRILEHLEKQMSGTSANTRTPANRPSATTRSSGLRPTM